MGKRLREKCKIRRNKKNVEEVVFGEEKKDTEKKGDLASENQVRKSTGSRAGGEKMTTYHSKNGQKNQETSSTEAVWGGGSTGRGKEVN